MRQRYLALCVLMLLAVLFAGCRSGSSSRINKNPEIFAGFPEDVQNRVRAGEIDLGYTEEMVTMALGEPDRVVNRRTEGREERVWVYTRSRGSVGLSFGTAFGAGGGGRSTAVGAGAGVGTGGSRAEETLRVVFVEGEVTAIEMLE